MNHRQILRVTLAVYLLLLLIPTAAAEAVLSVRVAVESQLPEVREQALKQAMAQVLVRLTGRDDVVETEAVELLERPGRYLQRYQYESQPGQQLILLLQFDSVAIRRALAAHGVETWRQDRPPVLVWLAVEQQGRRLLVGGEEGAQWRAQLQAAAARRGVQLLFPLMDSEDRQRISSTDVFGGFTERIQQASERYGAAVMLVGRVHPQGGGWTARWALSGVNAASWTAPAANLNDLLDAAAAELAGQLLPSYAMLATAKTETQQLVIEVQGVRTLRDYDRLERRLRGTPGVEAVRPLRLEPNAVTMQLTLAVTPERVLSALNQERSLLPLPVLPDHFGEEQEPQAVIFRLAL